MKKTDLKREKLLKLTDEVVSHFQHWSGDFVSEELEKYNASSPDLQDGLENLHTSLAIIGSVSESLYAINYPVVENESTSGNMGVKPQRIPDRKTSIDLADDFQLPSFESMPFPDDFSDSQNNLIDEEDSGDRYVDFEKTQSGEPFLSGQDEPHEVNEFPNLRIEDFQRNVFEDSNEIHVHEVEQENNSDLAESERNEINLHDKPLGRVESSVSEEYLIDPDQPEQLKPTHSIGGFGDFLNAISSEQTLDKKIEEQENSSTSDNWTFRDEFEPGTDHIKLNGRANGQKSKRKIISGNLEHISPELSVPERATDSLFKNEELFEEFSETIKQAYHKYYGKY